MNPESPTTLRTRNVLEGVPKVSFYAGGPRCPEDVPFPGVMRALTEYLGEDVGCYEVKTRSIDCRFGCTYSFFMGVTGCAFRLTWGEGWRLDNQEIMFMSDEPIRPFDHAFAAIGRSYSNLNKPDPEASENLFRQKIVESIDRGLPVIAFGVIGPPEACLITGYDETGEVLIGWNYFQDFPDFNAGVEFEPGGYFRKRNWYLETEGLLLLGDVKPKPEFKDTFHKSLEWALRVMQTPRVDSYGVPRANGIAAFNAWIEALQRDDEIASGGDAHLYECFGVHDDAVGTVAEGRWYGSIYLSRMANMGTGNIIRPEVLRAAACFAQEHDLMWDAWNTLGGIGREPEKMRNFAKPEIRQKIIPILQHTKALDEEATGHIAKALTGTSPG